MWVAYGGRAALWLALAAAIVAASALYAGERAGREDLARAGRTAFWALCATVAAASALLFGALAANDFSLSYVAAHSSVQTPIYYRLGAFWGGQEGSLLLWLLVLCSYGAYLLARPPREGRALMPYALAIIAAVAACFAVLVTVVAPPFVPLRVAPGNGLGLNRLLHDNSFLIHPVALYLGYVGFTVPFAFAMAGLLRGETGDHWIRVTHRWALTAWALLSIGIIMGAHWSYHVLGWGGYWSFDPVENAALLPWLLATAFIHSAMVQERRGMLKVWNAGLIAATYVLTLFGTFLTRSGIVESVHTFAQSPIGAWLLGICGLAVALSVYLIGSRLELLADERPFDSLVSKEGAFLLNNVVFLSLGITVLVGTLVPVISPYFGQAISVGTPYFERVTAPLFTIALLLAGVGPLLAWRRAGRREIVQHLVVPLVAAAAFASILASAGIRPVTIVVGMACAFFAAVAVLYDFGLGVAARLQIEATDVATAAYRLVARNPRRYGGYTVHLAMAVIAFGVIASQAFQKQYDQVDIHVGDTVAIGRLDVTYEGLGAYGAGGAVYTYARMGLSSGDRVMATLLPAFSVGSDAETSSGPTFDPAILEGLRQDIYVELEGYTPGGGEAIFNIFINPLVSWIWLGGLLMIAGTVFSLWPRRAMLAAPRSHRIFGLWSELEYDYRMGKIHPADYQALRARYAAEAEDALRKEGHETGGAAREVAAVEARIAARAAELADVQPSRVPVGTGGASQ